MTVRRPMPNGTTAGSGQLGNTGRGRGGAPLPAGCTIAYIQEREKERAMEDSAATERVHAGSEYM